MFILLHIFTRSVTYCSIDATRAKLRQADGNQRTPWPQLEVNAVIAAAIGGSGDRVPEIIALIDHRSLLEGAHANTICETDGTRSRSRSRPYAGCVATQRSSPSCSAAMVRYSTSDVPTAPQPELNAEHSERSTAPVPIPTAPSPSTPAGTTTSPPGYDPLATPTSTTCCHSAKHITTASTKAAGR